MDEWEGLADLIKHKANKGGSYKELNRLVNGMLKYQDLYDFDEKKECPICEDTVTVKPKAISVSKPVAKSTQVKKPGHDGLIFEETPKRKINF